MSQFTLVWVNTNIIANANVIDQVAQYRYRLVGGAFISSGFSPTNPLAKAATTTNSPVLDNNKVVQFQIQSDCTLSGPIYNDNGLQEAIEFAAITPSITPIAETTVTISINTTSTDIIKARFTLRKASDNSLVAISTISGAGTLSASFSGLVSNTNYYFQVELYAVVNSVEVISSSPSYVGSPYSPYPFTTATPTVCTPLTSVTVTSIEV